MGFPSDCSWFSNWYLIMLLLGMYFLLALVLSYIDHRRLRETSSKRTPEDRAAQSYLRWNLALTFSFLLHSMIAVNPRAFLPDVCGVAEMVDSEVALVSFLRNDTLIMLNGMHSIFVVGVAALFHQTRRLRYWWIQVVGLSFIILCALPTGLAALRQTLIFGGDASLALVLVCCHTVIATVCLQQSLAIKPLIRAKELDAIARGGEANDPVAAITLPRYLERIRQHTRAGVQMDCAIFILNIFIVCINVLVIDVRHVRMEHLIVELIQGYTMAIHKALVISQGFHGSINHRPEPLMFYGFGTLLFAAFTFAQVVPTFVKSLSEPKALLSLCLLVAQFTIQFFTATRALSLRSGLRASIPDYLLNKKGSGDGNAIAGNSLAKVAWDRKTDRALVVALRQGAVVTVLVGLFWQIESNLFVTAAINTSWDAAVSLTMVALNLGIHGVAVFHLQYFRLAESVTIFGNRRRLHFFLMLIMSGVSCFEGASAVVALLQNSNRFVGAVAALGLIRGVVYLVGAISMVQMRLVATPVGDSFAEPGSLPRNREESVEDTGASVMTETEINTERVRFITTSTSAVEAPRMPYAPADGGAGFEDQTHLWASAQWWANKCLQLLFVAFLVEACAIAMSETMAQLNSHFQNARLASLYISSEVVSHSNAYGLIYHFCFLLTGYGYRGIWYRNVANLGVLFLTGASFAAINVTSLCVKTFGALRPTDTPFNTAVYHIDQVLTMVLILTGVATCWRAYKLRHILIRTGASDQSEIW